MANPNVINNPTVVQGILVETRLASGNNDSVVPTGHAWTLKSITLANTSGGPVTVTGSAIKSGSVARVFLPAVVIAAGDVLVLGPAFVAMLPEAGTLRFNSSTADAVDVLITGVDAA